MRKPIAFSTKPPAGWVCIACLIALCIATGCVTDGWRAARGGALPDGLNLYVSLEGNDRWSGTLAKPNRSGTDGPFATIQGARDAIRSMTSAARQAQPITVYMREGTYRIGQPVEFTSADSGTPNAPITYAAYPDERPVISGGRRVSGWRETERNGRSVWRADLPDVKSGSWWFRELFVNGERRPRTRLPESGVCQFTDIVDTVEKPKWSSGVRTAMFADRDLRRWDNLEDVEIVALTRWIESRSPIDEVDPDKRTVTFSKQSTFRLEDTNNRGKYARYYVENILEALDQPGEWYLNRRDGTLYYIPKRGERLGRAVVEAPALPQLVRIVGGETHQAKVRNLHFRDLCFRHAEWEFPEDDAGSVQAAYEVPGAIYLEQAENCTLVGCTIEQAGTYGVELAQGCTNVEIRHCTIRDLGAGGVKVGHKSSHTTVADNEIAHGGRIYHSAVGVWVGNSGHNSIVHNHIHDLYYTGISVGWTWGYAPTDSQDNEVAYNHIHDIGQGLLSDMGGIYTLGSSENSRLHHNLIHDISSYAYGGWGIYPDEGTTHMLIEDNIVYRTKTGGFHLHYGKENIVRNNIFAFALIQQLQRTRNEDHKSFDFVGNIVYFTEGTLLGSNWDNDRFYMNKNLYWNPDPSEIDFKGATLDEWRARGHDVDSLIADPRFVDPESGDFRLRRNSPAFELGFQTIDLSEVGPRRRK